MTNNPNNHGILGDGSGNVVSSFNNITQVTINTEGEDVELARLLDGFISKDALHNTLHSPPECYFGTRKTVRNQIRGWIDDTNSAKSPLLWLNGPAGVGKSVIAKTVAGSHDQVVATFFFSTSSNRSGTTLFPTLAWQLARSIPDAKQHIIASLKNHGSLLTSEFEEQFDQLIAQPLKKCTMTSTSLPVMVIDGIDECTDEYMLTLLLQVLVRAAESGSMPLRFIISSRPEARIRAILEKVQNDKRKIERQYTVPSTVPRSLQRPSLFWQLRTWRIRIQSLLPDIRTRLYTPVIWVLRNPTLLLQDVRKLYRPVQLGVEQGGPPPEIRDNLLDRISPRPVISHIQIGFSEECRKDIARYLTDQFIAKGHQLGGDVSHLVERSCGQFLYASTIVRLLDDTDPKDVLEMARHSLLPTPDLNKLYQVILKKAKDAIRKRAREGGPDHGMELKILTDTLAILIVFAENVHFFNMRENFTVIESLISIKKDRLAGKLCKMHSVLKVVHGGSISVYHRSFLEFLQSQERSGEHYVAYPNALRRFLVLLSRAGLKYFVMDWCGQLLDDDRKMREAVANIAIACRRNYFKRSSSPVTLITLHDLIHYSLPFLSSVLFCRSICRFKEFIFGASTSFMVSILEYVFLMFFCLFILSFGSFIISLTIYTLFISHSLILPLFHPFLHLHFVTIVGVLFSWPPIPAVSAQQGFVAQFLSRVRVMEDNICALEAKISDPKLAGNAQLVDQLSSECRQKKEVLTNFQRRVFEHVQAMKASQSKSGIGSTASNPTLTNPVAPSYQGNPSAPPTNTEEAKKEQERRLMKDEERQRKKEKLVWLRWIRRKLSEENSTGADDGSLRVSIRLPNGSRAVKRFRQGASLTTLYTFVASQLIPAHLPEGRDPSTLPYGPIEGSMESCIESQLTAPDCDAQEWWGFCVVNAYPHRVIEWRANVRLGDVVCLRGGGQVVVEIFNLDKGRPRERTSATVNDDDDGYDKFKTELHVNGTKAPKTVVHGSATLRARKMCVSYLLKELGI